MIYKYVFWTGIVVKCHESRLLHNNQNIARQLLVTKLDKIINGENSVDAQKKLIEIKKSLANHQKREKLRLLKEKWKKTHESNIE